MQQLIEKLIHNLQLKPHPEGGWYKEVYRSAEKFDGEDDFPKGRNFCTSIYFLLSGDNFSAFHRIKSDETWHFYAGDALEVIEIDGSGNEIKTKLGSNSSVGECFQYTVKAGHWFGSRVYSGGDYSLVGCTVSPGFDFRDFEMAKRDDLLSSYPSLSSIIKELTRA